MIEKKLNTHSKLRKIKEISESPLPINSNDEWLTETQLSEIVKHPKNTIKIWRHRQIKGLKGEQGPPFNKIGRSVRYLRADVNNWMNSRRFSPT